MPPDPDATAPSTPESSLSANLHQLLAGAEEGVTVGAILDRVGGKGFGLLLMVLALPSALPVPAAGYSTPFGLLMMLLGAQMLAGRRTPWLPARARRLRFGPDATRRFLRTGARLFHMLERLVRPRWAWLNGPWSWPAMGLLVSVMAALMILPIPLTNTAPAGVIFLIGVGLSEKDGLFSAAAAILGIFAVLLYAYIIYLLATVGIDGVVALKDALIGWLSGGG